MIEHPTDDELALFVMGAYAELPVDALESHLASCDACAQRLAAEARLEVALDGAGAALAFCPECERVSPASRCAACGAAVRVGEWIIDEVLTASVRGRIYRAHRADGATVALKELRFDKAPTLADLDAFEREAKFLLALSHPNIPRFVASFQDGKGPATRLYLAQELIAGMSLQASLATHWYSEAEILGIAREALQILVYLQGLSPMVVHRDVKPANLIRRPDGTIALVDFGAARSRATSTTTTMTIVGTVGFAPLEQWAGITDATTDVFALGATLTYLLTREARDGASRTGLNVSPALARYLARLTAPIATERFANARAALAGLDALTAPSRARRWRALGPVGLVGGALVAGVIGGGVVYVGMRSHAVPKPPPPEPVMVVQPVPQPPAPPLPEPGPVTYPSQLSGMPAMPKRPPPPVLPPVKAPAHCGGGDCSLWIHVAPYTMNSSWLTPEVTSQALTVEAWMRPVDKVEVNWPHALSLSLSTTAITGAIDRHDLSATTKADGGWHHVAITTDGTTARLYLDGEEAAIRPCPQGCRTPSLKWGMGLSGTGLVDEIQVWTAVRTRDEIRADRKRKPRIDEAGLVGYFHFDGGAALAPGDATGRNPPFEIGYRRDTPTGDSFFRAADAPPMGR